MIYVLRNGGTGIVKIGFTKGKKTMKSRIMTLQIGNPEKLRLEATMPGSKLKERYLHSVLVGRHVRGEWFRLSKQEVIRMVKKYERWSPSHDGIYSMPDLRNFKKMGEGVNAVWAGVFHKVDKASKSGSHPGFSKGFNVMRSVGRNMTSNRRLVDRFRRNMNSLLDRSVITKGEYDCWMRGLKATHAQK